jgi:hypothetical protein
MNADDIYEEYLRAQLRPPTPPRTQGGSTYRHQPRVPPANVLTGPETAVTDAPDSTPGDEQFRQWLDAQAGETATDVALQQTQPVAPPVGVTGVDEASIALPPDKDPDVEAAKFTDLLKEIGRGFESGLYSAGEELYGTLGLGEFRNWLTEVTGGPWEFSDPPSTAAGEIAQGFSQFGTGIIPIVKGAQWLGIANNLLKWTMASFVTDFAFFGPDEPGAGELARDIGELDNEKLEAVRLVVQEYLEKDEDDSDFVKKFKNAAGWTVVGLGFDGLIAGFKGARILNKNPQLRDTVERFLADESGEMPLKRRGSGQYVGAPAGLSSPQKLASLRRKLTGLATSATDAVPHSKFWYERSGKAILEMFNGDIDRADKFVQVLSVTSAGNEVGKNLSATIRAIQQWNAGGKIRAGRFPERDAPEIQGILDGTGDVSGIKRTAFYANLMAEIDPSRVPADAVTVDVWMMRAFGYKSKGGKHTGESVSPEQNAFVQRETRRIADQLGWEPHQVQAAIWVAAKAGDKGKPLEWAARDFADGLADNLGQINWEAIPHPDNPAMRGLFDADPQVKAAYHQAAADAFLDADGNDLVAKGLGIDSPGDFDRLDRPGAFEGGTQPGAITEILVPAKISSKQNTRLDDETVLLINTYAGLRAALLNQKAISWHRPVYRGPLKDMNGVDVDLGRPITADETTKVYEAINRRGGDVNMHAPISTENGFHVLNFPGEDGTFAIENKEFRALIGDAADDTFEKVDVQPNYQSFSSEGDYLFTDPIGDPYGKRHLAIASRAGRPDLQRKVDDLYAEVAPRLDAVDAEFAEAHGFTSRFRITEKAESQGAAP